MSARRLSALVVLTLIIALRVLAYASPPDPDWIAGFWDDGDYDDVVILVTTTHGATDVRVPLDVRATDAVVAVVDVAQPRAPRIELPSTRQPRAPPAP